MRRLGVAGGVLIVTAALALAACGGSGDSALKANATATTATTIINQQGGGGNGAATTGAPTPHGTATATSTPHGTSASNPHGTTTSTQAATTTTRLNTIKPLPGQPVAPYFSSPDYTYLTPNHPKTDAYGQKSGVCYGTPPARRMDLALGDVATTDFVEINRGSTNYPAEHLDYQLRGSVSRSSGYLSLYRVRGPHRIRAGRGGNAAKSASTWTRTIAHDMLAGRS